MVDSTLRKYTGTEYKIELPGGAQPWRPFPIPKVHEETLKP